ncbi:MAG TPA: hypothetical protein VJ302_36840 [Blastocatellia bacterium]|nr:hypothetical protein [Blastocatellia bacterium]
MTIPKFMFKVLLTWMALVAAQTVSNLLVPPGITMTAAANSLPWYLISSLLVAVILAVTALRSEWRGWRLAAALSTIPMVTAAANNLEAKLFLTAWGFRWAWVIGQPLLAAALATPLWVLIFGQGPEDLEVNYRPFQFRSPGQRGWRFAVSALAYAVLYFLVGILVIPYVQDFYTFETIPRARVIFALQLLVRGPAYVAVCLLLVRMLGLPARTGALAVGLVFATVNSIAPLLVPNGIFPDEVRWAHLCEAGSSNFVFGAFVAWLWGKPESGPNVRSAGSEEPRLQPSPINR